MTQRTLLGCRLLDERIAVPLERVIGVVESGAVTPLPYSASAFEGLVEAFGQIMPQVSLASLLSLRTSEGGMLVVVSDRGGTLALRVLSVTGVIQVEAESIPPSANWARARNPMYIGEIEQQGEKIYVLDVDLIPTNDVLELSSVEGAVIVPESAPIELNVAPLEDLLPLLMLEIAGERYAIPNESILELTVPGEIRPMPGAPDWILGLIDVRGTPMVALSTASLLGRKSNNPEVCLIAELPDGFPIALIVDHALGLERISPGLIHAMPQAMAGIRGYVVLGENQIVGVIDPPQLVSQVEAPLREALPRRATETSQVMANKAGNNRQLLAVRVGRELYGMDLGRIERIQAWVHLTPLPEAIQNFDGMADVGDAVVPVIDLRRQHGTALAAFDTTEKPPCILTTLQGAQIGILVDQVLSILDIPPDRFELVKDASRLPISHVVAFEDRLISVLTIDRLLPSV